MPSPLDNLVTAGKLKAEPPAQAEIDGLLHSGAVRVADAQKGTNSLESRFDLPYNAAHAFSLAALRYRGYRSDSRYLVFQVLPHTIGLSTAEWRVLDTAHKKRNLTEYEGTSDIDEALVSAVVRVALEVETRVRALGPVPESA
jgi:hypothetical protein